MNERILIAIIASPQGLDGSVRLKSFAETPDNLKRYTSFETARGPLTLKSLRVQPNAIVAKFAEIVDRTAAETWRNASLHVARARLPALDGGDYYQADLIGLTALSQTGIELGAVVAMPNYGAGDLLEIRHHTGQEYLIAYTNDAVISVDLAARTLTIAEEMLDA